MHKPYQEGNYARVLQPSDGIKISGSLLKKPRGMDILI